MQFLHFSPPPNLVNDFWNSTTSPLVSTPYPFESSSSTTRSSLFIETSTFFDSSTEIPTFSSDYTTYMGNETAALPCNKNGHCLTGYGRFLEFFRKLFGYIISSPVKIIGTIVMFLVNYFFPIVNRTVCDVSVNNLSASKRVLDFALKIFYVVDKDAPEKVTATIKCVEIPTDKRDYWYTLISAVCVLFIFLFLVLIDAKKWNTRPMPVLTPSPALRINRDLMFHDEPDRDGPAGPNERPDDPLIG
ncbi:hypothetical protein BDF21DRAFT_406763 [Thamnidium elegans]|nr:hypothetical protein BDF21DRAFT_406763 [Thamnidium elegans]